jgi:hypothetical protein
VRRPSLRRPGRGADCAAAALFCGWSDDHPATVVAGLDRAIQ